MSKRITQLIYLLEFIKDDFTKDRPVQKIRKEAAKFLADKYGLMSYDTVQDKYIRQIKDKEGKNLGTENFDRLINNWIMEGDTELKDMILRHCIDKNDEQLVYNFFKNNYEVEKKTNNWNFQVNPKYYDFKGSLKYLKEQNWLAVQHKDKMHKGDKVYLWQSGLWAGIYAIAELLAEPGLLPFDPEEERFVKKPEKFVGKESRVRAAIKQVLRKPLYKSAFLAEPHLANLRIITAPQGSNFLLTPEQAQLLDQLIALSSRQPQIWWVNQETTLEAEMEGAFLWAPLKSKSGRSMSHWETMAEVSRDDIVVHYANGALLYMSKVLEPAVEAAKPASLRQGDRSKEGRLVRVEYHELTPPIPLQKFAGTLRPLKISQGPIDGSGRVKQGYLFRLTPEALGIIQKSQSETIWPDFPG
jgi:hypothetical protein